MRGNVISKYQQVPFQAKKTKENNKGAKTELCHQATLSGAVPHPMKEMALVVSKVIFLGYVHNLFFAAIN